MATGALCLVEDALSAQSRFAIACGEFACANFACYRVLDGVYRSRPPVRLSKCVNLFLTRHTLHFFRGPIKFKIGFENCAEFPILETLPNKIGKFFCAAIVRLRSTLANQIRTLPGNSRDGLSRPHINGVARKGTITQRLGMACFPSATAATLTAVCR